MTLCNNDLAWQRRMWVYKKYAAHSYCTGRQDDALFGFTMMMKKKMMKLDLIPGAYFQWGLPEKYVIEWPHLIKIPLYFKNASISFSKTMKLDKVDKTFAILL